MANYKPLPSIPEDGQAVSISNIKPNDDCEVLFTENKRIAIVCLATWGFPPFTCYYTVVDMDSKTIIWSLDGGYKDTLRKIFSSDLLKDLSDLNHLNNLNYNEPLEFNIIED